MTEEMVMVVQIVRYRSGLTHEEVAQRFRDRASGYAHVPGLVQKYYVRYPASGEYGGIYVWDSLESMQRWRDTTLAQTLSETYAVVDPPQVELADVMLVLRPEQSASLAD
jgi:heme-degrading monooxygenase HmoA